MIPAIAALLPLFAHAPIDAPAPAAQTPAAAVEVIPRAELALILRHSRREGGPEVDACIEQAVKLGPAVVDALVEVLLSGRMPEVPSDTEPALLSPAQRSILLGALARLPHQRARLALRPALQATDKDVVACVAVIEVLGVIGDSRDLAGMCQIAPRRGPDDPALVREAREALREAAGAILARDPKTWSSLVGVLHRVDDHVGRALLQGFDQRRDPRALAHLYELARTRPTLLTSIVAVIATCGRSTDAELDREVVSWMVDYLELAEREQARTLLRGIGALDDGDAVPVLIKLLDDDDPTLSETALSALQRISGFGFSPDATVWNAWYSDEVRWHERERPRCLDKLHSGSPALVAEALRDYSDRRLRRAELAQEVAVVLERPDPAMRRLACETLRQLGTAAASVALVNAMYDTDDSVVEAAWQALRAISGLDLPRDADGAREALATR